jgi:transcriptional regulator with XRE-family HTH domain
MAKTAPDPTDRVILIRRFVETERRRVWGPRCRARRKELGLSLEVVAGMCGVSPQTIHKVETGEITPREHLRYALALALMVEPDALFPAPSAADLRSAIAA